MEPLISIPIYLGDLCEKTQNCVKERLKEELRSEMLQQSGESDEDYGRRINDKAADYIKRHDFSSDFFL